MTLIDFPYPKTLGKLNNNDILYGAHIPAIEKIKIISNEQFENLIREWIVGYIIPKKATYNACKKCSGAGDKGRDVIGVISDEQIYDNFQCKHYDHPLTPGDVWKEIGKMCYYSYKGEYVVPKAYYFVSPQGIGPKLNGYFEKPDELKNQFLLAWNDYCKTQISKGGIIELDKALNGYITGIDFSIFKGYDPQQLIEEYRQTPYYAAMFGGGLQKRRDIVAAAPKSLADRELTYTCQLFEAYSDFTKKTLSSREDLSFNIELLSHFDRQRESFYSADALNQFSRDCLPPDTDYFEDLKHEFYAGVIDVVEEDYCDGYKRLKATTNFAKQLKADSSPLFSYMRISDKEGVCHHLANEKRIVWVKK